MSEYGRSYYVGDTVFDTLCKFSRGDGISYPAGVEILQTITMQTSLGSVLIDDILRDNHCGTYINGQAMVVGEDDHGNKVVAWSYDQRTLTIQVVKGLR